jgi:hypothetical protein
VHGPNLDYVADLFTLENTIATTSGHASNIQQLGTVDHVVIWKGHVVSVCSQSETIHGAVAHPRDVPRKCRGLRPESIDCLHLPTT